MSSEIYYVYQYVTEDGIPYYIGKGKGNRLNEKHKHTVTPEENRRNFIEQNLSEVDALTLERTLIRKYGRKVDGGLLDNTKMNQWACTSGWKHSETTKQKISSTTLGKLKSEETKAKMRKPKTAEHAQKIREARIGTKRSDETKAKISAAKAGQGWTLARRAAQQARSQQ